MVKSVFSGLEEMRKEWNENDSFTRYNSYKLLGEAFPFPPSNLQGYDILLDDALHPHLLEINNRPSIFTKPVDMAVNKPMVEEIFRLVGYHLPPSAVQPEFIEVRSMFWTH